MRLRQMELPKMRLQIQPDRLPVLRRRFHHHFVHLALFQPTHQMAALLRSGSKRATLKLHCGPNRIEHLVSHGGHHDHQHLFVDVDCCYLVWHIVLSSGEEVAGRA